MHGLEGSAFRAWVENMKAMDEAKEEEQRMQLHDLTVIRSDKESTTVTHGIDMIRHLL